VNEEEAEVVRRIFKYYNDGMSSLEITDILNTEGIPAPYTTRIGEAIEKRKRRGLPTKEYAENLANYEQIKWRPSTINRIIKNGKCEDLWFYSTKICAIQL